MGKLLKQAENVRRRMEVRVHQIQKEIEVDSMKKLMAMADNMGVRVIQELMNMTFLERLKFAFMLMTMPVVKWFQRQYKRLTRHAEEETPTSDPS